MTLQTFTTISLICQKKNNESSKQTYFTQYASRPVFTVYCNVPEGGYASHFLTAGCLLFVTETKDGKA